MLRRATEAEVLYNAARANRTSLEERLATIRRDLVRQKHDLVPAVTELASTRARRLKVRLAELKGQYVELRVQNYPTTHPKLVALQQEIEDTKKNLTDEAEKLAGGQSVVDPIPEMENYASEATALQIEIESTRAQEAALKRVMSGYDAQLGHLPDKAFNLARLTRERDVSHKIYTMLLEKLEEARLAEAEKIPSIRIIDTALTPDRPIKPRKRLNLVLGMMLGLIGGTSLAFVLEAARPTVESSLELENLTGWPVLGSDRAPLTVH